ncbi:hypothetical protein EJ069_17020 [Mesorhizobium sp. M2A.F.Ca.ET.043.05.1.1]|nr:hypothetical protein EJ069_17020 [Mesorhizobium sp. M2A.F.Ca.ET.043.05.1.1]
MAFRRRSPSSGRFAATFSPVGRRSWRRRRQSPLPTGGPKDGRDPWLAPEWSAERSGGWVRGRLRLGRAAGPTQAHCFASAHSYCAPQ